MATLEEKFWARVHKTTDGCWVWQGFKTSYGYGGLKHEGKLLLASRVSYELNFGPIPAGGCVCHRCDNKPCVRPDHLFLGSRADNNKDRRIKGLYTSIGMPAARAAEVAALAAEPLTRSDFGGENVNAKLTDERVAYARANPDGLSVRELACRFGVCAKTMHQAILGLTWRHLKTPSNQ